MADEYRIARQIEVDGVEAEASQGADGQLSLQWSMESAGEFTIYAAVAVRQGQRDAPVDQAMAALAEARHQGPAALRDGVQAYWHDFWSRSFVYVTNPDGLADYVENAWYLHLYWMAASSRGEYVPKFNGGNWLCHRDERGWEGRYWYQNTREQYWPVLAANHADLARPFYDLYWRTLPKHRQLARELFGTGGAQVEETMRLDGDGDKRGNAYTCLYLTTGTECALQFYRYYEFTRDEGFLRDRTGFMVAAQREMQEVRVVAVESLRGSECRIVNPWPDRAVVRRGSDVVLESAEAVLVFPTEKGTT